MAKNTAGEQPKALNETDLINRALADKDISMNALADETGIPYSSLRRSLKGGRALTIPEIRSIAAALGVWPSELLPDELTTRQDAA
jgi:lambda repressor-like predicted transcriptional regulator